VSRVQAIRRAFAVLDALADGPVGVTHVAAATRLPKSTVARLLDTMQAEGVVQQVAGDARYRLGPRIATLAGGLHDTRGLVATAHPSLVELAGETGEATGLSVPDGSFVHYVDQVDSPNPVQVRDWTGSRIPMHAVSSGQVFLAFMPAPALVRLLAEPRERFTQLTIVEAGSLLERLRRVRQDGYAWVREEFSEGITSVAAPIASADGEVIAAVHVHGPSYRFPAPGNEKRIAASVVAAASEIRVRLRG
jgi:DNA-binding IclR family transcriptional regulator